MKLLSAALCAFLAVPILPVSARMPDAEILFARLSEGGRGIGAIRPASGDQRRLSKGTHQYPKWSPDRTKVAFVETIGDTYSPRALWVMDRDGSHKRKLVDLHAQDSYQPNRYDWAPDGSRIVYSDQADPDASYDLSIVDVASLDVEQLTTDSETHETNPDWSPDGTSVVFEMAGTGIPPSADYNVYTVLVADKTVRQLTTDPGIDYSPRWSPDGSRVGFLSTRDDEADPEVGPYSWEIYLIDPDGSNETRLTEEATRKSAPVWSPNGEFIAYNSRCDDDLCGDRYADNIHTVEVSTGTIKRITDKGRRTEDFPAWSPDGRWIAYSLFLRGGRDYDIAMTRVRDRHTVRVTETAKVDEAQPQWANY
jgi:TolB protein